MTMYNNVIDMLAANGLTAIIKTDLLTFKFTTSFSTQNFPYKVLKIRNQWKLIGKFTFSDHTTVCR